MSNEYEACQGAAGCPPWGGSPLLESPQLPGKPQSIRAERTLGISLLTNEHLLSISTVSGTVLTLKKTGSERLNNLSKVRQIVKAKTSLRN